MMKITNQECPKSPSSNTDQNNTERNNNQSNPIVSIEKKEIDAIGAYRIVLCDNISYDVLCSQYDKESVDEILELMLEVVASPKKTFRIGGADINAMAVKSRFMKLNIFHIQYVFTCLDQSTTKIRNIKQYLLTSLYNAPATINNYYKAQVRYDMHSG